jgi:hypothetical protein
MTMFIRRPSASEQVDEPPVALPPVAQSVDLLGIIRRQLAEGLTPPDPERCLATPTPAPPEKALVYMRAKELGSAARQAANSQANFDTESLRNRAMDLGQQAAERQPQIESLQERKEHVNDKQRYYDESLRPLAYRPTGLIESIRYYAIQGFLALADVGNIAAATHNVLGDPLPLAIIQGVGVGVANVTAGQLGGELRARREHAKRASKAPTDGESFQPWYGDDRGERESNWILGVCALGVSLTFIGQFALRAVFDGSPVGLVYAAFAVVVVIGSFVNSYVHGALDEVTHYKIGLDVEDDAITRRITDLKLPEATAAGLQAEIEAHSNALTSQGEAVAHMAIVEAFTLMIQYPNMFGTHTAEITGSKEAENTENDDDTEEDEDLDVTRLKPVHTQSLAAPDPFAVDGDGVGAHQ